MASQVIPCLLQSLKCHCLVHKLPPLNPVLNQLHPVRTSTVYLFCVKTYFNIVFLYMPRSVVSSRVLLTAVFHSPVTCCVSSHLILTSSVTSALLTMRRPASYHAPNCVFHPSVACYHWGPNILMSMILDYPQSVFLYMYETLGMSWELTVHKFWTTAFRMVTPNIFSSFSPITYRNNYFLHAQSTKCTVTLKFTCHSRIVFPQCGTCFI